MVTAETNPPRRGPKPTAIVVLLLVVVFASLFLRTNELKAQTSIGRRGGPSYQTNHEIASQATQRNLTRSKPDVVIDDGEQKVVVIGGVAEKNLPIEPKANAQADANYQINTRAGCHENCPDDDRHRNILLLDHFGAAGLTDRIRILSNFAEIAAYMCARVYVPPPNSMLRSEHNGGVPVHRNLTWADMIDIRYGYDNASALVQYPMDFDPMRSIRQKFNLSGVLAGPKYANWTRVTMKSRNMMLEQLAMLENYYAEDHNRQSSTGFIWEIHDRYSYKTVISKWAKRRGEGHREGRPPGNCTSQELSTPLSRSLADRVFAILSERYPSTDSFVPIHIRRGDSMRSCDTSLERMHQRLSCSLGQSSASRRNLTVLLGTDESDPCYRTALKVVVEGMGHAFADLDATVSLALQEYANGTDGGERLLNNMFVYSVSQNVVWNPRIDSRLEWRRDVSCLDCVRLPSLKEPEHHSNMEGAVSLTSRPIRYEEAYHRCRRDLVSKNGTGEHHVAIGYVAKKG